MAREGSLIDLRGHLRVRLGGDQCDEYVVHRDCTCSKSRSQKFRQSRQDMQLVHQRVD